MSRRLTLKHLYEDADKVGIECYATSYIGTKSRYPFGCKICGHKWEAFHYGVRHGKKGCPKCAGNIKPTTEEIITKATAVGLKCLNTEDYRNNEYKLRYQCKWHKPFLARPGSITMGHGCHVCSIKKKGASQRLNIETEQNETLKKGIILLSPFYFNNHTKLRYLCPKCWKEWHAVPMAIRKENHTGCPYCKQSNGERVCRDIFEEIFNTKFKIYYPKWLSRSSYSHPHLDGYNSKLKIAFEKQGKQHFEEVVFFHRGRSLEETKEMDQFKVDKCKENGITLIVVPNFTNHKGVVDYKGMKQFIINKLKENAIKI